MHVPSGEKEKKVTAANSAPGVSILRARAQHLGDVQAPTKRRPRLLSSI
jgi:hypothetical protein